MYPLSWKVLIRSPLTEITVEHLVVQSLFNTTTSTDMSQGFVACDTQFSVQVFKLTPPWLHQILITQQIRSELVPRMLNVTNEIKNCQSCYVYWLKLCTSCVYFLGVDHLPCNTSVLSSSVFSVAGKKLLPRMELLLQLHDVDLPYCLKKTTSVRPGALKVPEVRVFLYAAGCSRRLTDSTLNYVPNTREN